jgi:23S rRNA (cytidine1920-2'-O)/16S rRNA (cytidine1409-2'-O)-methyltransferase
MGALDDLQLSVSGRALDAGVSTEGFTQVLLARGCREVIAVDVGSVNWAAELRADPGVPLHERTNLRDLHLDWVEGVAVDLAVADVSFISLRLLVGRLVSVTQDDGGVLLLIKPQFEVGRELVGKGGSSARRRTNSGPSRGVISAAAEYWHGVGAIPSRLPEASGNREFYLLLRRTESAPELDLTALVEPSPSAASGASKSNTEYAVAGDRGLSTEEWPAKRR